MLKRAFRRTTFGRRHEVFSHGTTHKMFFGMFGLDPGGNVIAFPMFRAGPTAGSWSIAVVDSVSVPLHWWARAEFEKSKSTCDVYDRSKMCRMPGMRIFYKTVRFFYLLVLGYIVFAAYILVKQNVLNVEARLVLSNAERAAVQAIQEALEITDANDAKAATAGGGSGSDHNNNDADGKALISLPPEAKSFLRKTGCTVRDVAFAVAEDLSIYDPNVEVEDGIALMARKAEKARIFKSQQVREQKQSAETQSKVWRWVTAAGTMIGCAALVILL